MITKMTHVSLYVHDQEEALKFYRDKMGLKVHTDADFSGMRWLTLHAADAPDFELVIFKATKPESQALVGKQAPEGPLFVFNSDDCKGDAAALAAKGVKFVEEPTQKPWGLEALFLDLYGNIIMINQS